MSDIKELLKKNRKERENNLHSADKEEGLAGAVSSSAQNLGSKLNEQASAAPVEERSYEELKSEQIKTYEEAASAEEGEDNLDKNLLGCSIVTIKKVLGQEHAIEDSDHGIIRTAVIDHDGKEKIAGIWPGIDYSKIIEGDKAIYDDKEEGNNMLCRLIDCITPGKIPEVTFEDIGGLDRQIEETKSLLEIFDPEARKRSAKLKRKLRNGGLFYGPAGTGKTMLAEAAANYAKVPFFSVNTPEVFDMYLGGSVNKLKGWDTAARKYAKKYGGAILYFDEITRLGAKRNYDSSGADSEVSGVTEELQALMNGDHYLDSDEGIVLYMASTNLETKLDLAVLRRFKEHIRVWPPNREGKESILAVKIRNIPYENMDIPIIINNLDDIKPGATGADIDIITEKAKLYAEMAGREHLDGKDFEKSLEYFSHRVDVLLLRNKHGDSKHF